MQATGPCWRGLFSRRDKSYEFGAGISFSSRKALRSKTVADIQLQCRILSSLLPQKVFTKGDATYSESLSSYYSTQESDLHPSCILRPETVSDVSIALKSLTSSKKYKCRFAIRSGGHTPFAGSANIASGVTFDLRALNKVTVSNDNSTTSVGGGAKWGDVYKKLDPLNLSVSGGRADVVGVGGLTTGGVCCFYSLASRYWKLMC